MTLNVEKRSHGPKGEPMTLRWRAGILTPPTEKETNQLAEACVTAAIRAAKQGTPIQARRRLPPESWEYDYITKLAGFPPKDRDIKEALAQAARDGKLRYHCNATGGRKADKAGYYPPIENAQDMAAAIARGEA